MNFDSYTTSSTKIAKSLPLDCILSIKPHRSNGFGLKAFTLAETLITLTIIGVVAALTIPTLLTNYQKQSYVTGLKKVYSQLNQMVKTAIIQEGCPSGDIKCAVEAAGGEIDFNSAPLIKRYMKVAYDCTGDNKTNLPECANSPFKNTLFFGDFDFLILDDGTALTNGFHSLTVDVNGTKGPNKLGRDQFALGLGMSYGGSTGYTTGLIVPYGTEGLNGGYHDGFYKQCSTENVNTWYAMRCTARVLREDAMNY